MGHDKKSQPCNFQVWPEAKAALARKARPRTNTEPLRRLDTGEQQEGSGKRWQLGDMEGSGKN